ncbi:MAG: CBS domain-containing protein [Chitinivibrionales bacterium]|nr:CBS domain-containing protein [Chitinivibrionales bacterium]
MKGEASMKAEEIMTHTAESVGALETVRRAAQLMESMNVSALPVIDKGTPVGMVTDRDIIVRSVAQDKNPSTTTVGEIMTPEVIFCMVDADISEVAHIMQYKKIRRLLVKNQDDQIVGIISLGDLAMSTEANLTGEVMRDVTGVAHPER